MNKYTVHLHSGPSVEVEAAQFSIESGNLMFTDDAGKMVASFSLWAYVEKGEESV